MSVNFSEYTGAVRTHKQESVIQYSLLTRGLEYLGVKGVDILTVLLMIREW